jgi:SpoIID/LytB domain protein
VRGGRRLQKRLGLPLGVVALMLALPMVAGASTSDEWEFDGGGWGHGVGMPQFGAQGKALAGNDYRAILEYYYPGTELSLLLGLDVPGWLFESEALWVGLLANQTSRAVQITSSGTFALCVGQAGTCDEPDLLLTQGDTLDVAVAGANPLTCAYGVAGSAEPPAVGECWADLSWDQVNPGSHRVRVNGIEYARGTLRIRPNRANVSSATGFHISLTVGLEHYLYGIAESLLHWDMDALRAQAVTARSYGVNRAVLRDDPSTGLPSDSWKDNCWCHLRRTTADQAYSGWSGGNPTEGDPTYGQKWRDAVDETAGEVLTHPTLANGTRPVETYYFSSSGGWTEDVEFVFGGTPRAWLRAVEDPYSSYPGNGNGLASWTVVVPGDSLAAIFGWDRVTDVRVVESPPGSLVRFTGSKNGSTVTTSRTGVEMRPLLESIGYRRNGGKVRVSPYVAHVRYTGRFIDGVGHLFEAEITWLANEGITKGCNPPTNSMFCPNDVVTRGQMAAFLRRALGLPSSSTDWFTDDNGSIFESDINALAAAGITRGCNPPANDRFCPDDPVSRGQMAAFMRRAFGLPASAEDFFVDDDGSLFEAEINALAGAGITRGCNPPDNTRFCPSQSVTRGQMAAFLKRASDFSG